MKFLSQKRWILFEQKIHQTLKLVGLFIQDPRVGKKVIYQYP